MKPYGWQREVVDLLIETGSVLLQAPPGAGKSYVATMVKERLRTYPLVIINTRDMVDQWKREYGLDAATIQGICNLPKDKKVKAKVIILDESQHYESEVWSQIYDRIDCEYLLGMSATPNESVRRFETTFVVPWGSIDLPRFSFHYHYFDMSSADWEEYDRLTKQMKDVFKRQPETKQEEKALERKRLLIALARRRVCHKSRNRFYDAVKLISGVKGKRTLIVCQTIEQSDMIGRALKIPSYHSKARKDVKDRLNDFLTGNIDMISSVNMLKEGFNCPEIDTLVIVSSALTDTHYVQLMGRALRVYKNKRVRIYVMIARNTTDESLVGLGESITGMTNEKRILE